MPSSVIRNFRYLPEDEALEITFVSGKRYRYRQVPEEVYRQMRAVTSRGEFFNQHIRDHFDFVRIEDRNARNPDDADGVAQPPPVTRPS